MATSSIKVEPGEITFNSAKPGVLYVMTISVRNITTTAQRIRLQAPKSGIFALNYIPAGVIAPGLDLRAEIECQIPLEMPETVFNDKIVAIMGNEKIEIPIRAIKPFADITFDHTVSLGNVFLNQLITKDLYFENKSDISGTVKFSLPRGSTIKLSTTKLDLKPFGNDGCRQFVRVSLESKEVGTIREFLKVNVVGSVEEMHIDISAQVIEQQLTLLSENKEGLLENVQFGTIFYGERRKVIGMLVNAGPLPLSFSMKYDDEDESGGNPQSDTTESMYNKALSVSPVDGIVKPFSTLPIAFNFEPVQFIPERGFTQQQLKENEEPRPIGRNVKIDCLDLNQSIAVTMNGKAQIPLVSMTPSVLRFGDCPVNDRRDILITLVNKTKLITTFEFPAVATFKFEPTRGKILGNETVSVIASFIPPQLGTFKTTIHVSIAGGLKGYDLKVVGEASQPGSKKVIVGGTDKLPNDFLPHRKFVNPEEEATARMEKRKVKEEKQLQIEADMRTLLINNSKPGFVIDASVRPTLDTLDPKVLPSVIDASQERDELYGTDPNITRKNDPNMTVQHMQFLQDRQHKKIYNEFLQKSHYDRELLDMARSKKKMLEKGAVDFSDPFGINMGIERGLDEPVLKIPPAVEPLWMTGAGGGPGNAKGRLPVDENRLIQKKYGSSPATQAELRDCSTELNADDLKLVTASHKVIDFGKVCVGSSSAKNFVVFNGLKHSVLVTIEDLEIELQQSKALTQIIPESCMAGFDIYFSSRVLGKVKKSFTWKINGIHIFKVHVLAEVVPIELTMNKTELVMEFPSDLLKSTLSADIILSNPGNAYAEYLWGSVGAFTCDPEKGSIAPSKSAVVTITWDPHGGKRTEEEIGLHVSGGVDQVLKVKGVLHETKAEFADKRLALGIMAVGTERQITTVIANTGENPLVFFMNPLEDQLGIKLDPMEGHILPGESMDLKVTIVPKVARNYDNVNITAKVRGGKSISLRLTGSSIIPQIEVVEESFRFGTVTVGSDLRLPLTLKNKSQITATMILDLSSFPDYFPYLMNPLDEPDLATKEFGPVSATQEDEIGNQILLVSNKGSNYAFTEDEKISGNRKQKKKVVENMWKISIPQHSILHAELIFRPSVPRKYQFRLPLNLVGMADDKTLQKDISGLSVACPLVFSSFVTDFGDRVVSRDALARVSYFLETTITNNGQTGVSFVIKEGPEVLQAFDGSPLSESDQATDANESLMGGEKQQIFFVSPLKLDLAPGATTKLRVTFLPQQNCTYSKKLGLFMKDQTDQSRPYLNLLCVGSGVYPCMSFSTQHLRLPTVPLGVPSRAVFTLLNHGYASLDIKHRISPNITVPIEVSYPDGNQVGIMVDRIRVVLTAKSDQPISWSGKIEFYDMDGERFFLGISGCSDNCLFANYHFVRDYTAEYGFIGLDDQPVQFLPQPQIAELRQIEAKRKEELRRQRSLERLRAVEGKTGTDSSPTRKGKGKDDVSTSLASKSSKQSLKQDTMSRVDSSQQLSYAEGIDIDKVASVLPEDAEAAFLLKWLNRNVCRKPFETEKFPSCILETTGDIVIDCLEQMSGKKITNLTPQERRFGEPRRGSDTAKDQEAGGNNKRSSEKGKQIAAADKIVFKYQQILNFLVNHGALLSHVNPVALLNRDEHLLIQEHDITKDKSVHFTPAMLASRRQIWMDQWLEQCKRGWLELLYQGIKVFILTRLNYKEFMTLPGMVLSSAPEMSISKKESSKDKNNKKKEKETIPKHLQSSNVFTHGESILLAWLSYHLEHADHCVDEGAKGTNPDKLISFNKRVVDIDGTFKDFYHFCQLMHSHVMDITQKGEPLHGYTAVDRTKQDILYACFEEALLQYRCDIPNISFDDIVISSRNILLMLLHMYLSLPHLIPKAKVDFTGVLGIPIAKKIELKNSAKKPLSYEVSIKGNPDFEVEAKQFTIPAESAAEFLVTLNAHFMHQVKAKLYFWNIRDPATLANGATLCFQCVSQITGMKPVDLINRNVHLFDYENFPLQVRNPYPRDVVLHVKLVVKYCAKTIYDFVGGKPKKGSRSGSGEVFIDVPITKPVAELQSGNNDGNVKNANDDWDLENLYRQPFWIQEETIAIPKGGMRTMKVMMLPFLLGKYVCQVVFVDAEQGEFCHEINADVGLPKPSDRLDLNILQGSKVNILLTFNSKNPAFEKAYGVASETRIKNANKKIRARAIFQNLMSSLIQNEETGQSNFLLDFTANFFSYKRPIPFLSEYLKWPVKQPPTGPASTKEKDNHQNTSKFKRIPKTLLDIIAPTDEVFVAANYEGLNKSLLAFTPERAGVYKTTGVVYAEDNPCDIRCVELSITARVPDAKMVLEFSGPARKKLIQDIPITNETDSDWTLNIGVGTGNKEKDKEKDNSVFSQKPFTTFPKKTLVVPRHGQANLQVAFYSCIAGSFQGKLQLRNVENNDVFDYALNGMAEDTLAEEHYNFSCTARRKANFSIPLPSLQYLLNPDMDAKDKDEREIPQSHKFLIESDLPYMNSFKTVELHMDDQSPNNLNFSINSPVGGMLSGYIGLRDSDPNSKSGLLLWYTVNVDITAPKEEKSIEVEATVRTAVSIAITLSNPINEELVFDVSFIGDGLFGDSSFVLPPKDSATEGSTTYELVYSPLIAGTFMGKVSFWNETLGDLWYKLVLNAKPAPPMELEMIESMLGSENFVEAPVENPSKENIVYHIEVSDPEHFFVQYPKIALSPFMQTTLKIFFKPSMLNEIVSSTVRLLNTTVGEAVYAVKGKGLLPGVMAPVTVEGPLHEIVSESIIFRNPFPHPLPMEVFIDKTTTSVTSAPQNPGSNKKNIPPPTEEGIFSLLMRKSTDLVLASKTPLHIPVGFSPKHLGIYHTTVQVRATVGGHNLLWCFPVQGIAEMGQVMKLPPMKASSKTSLMKEYVLPMSGIRKKDVHDDLKLSDFSIVLKIEDELSKNLVSRSFRIQPLEIVGYNEICQQAQNNSNIIIIHNSDPTIDVDFGLRCRFLFEPLRVFTTPIDVSIICRNRGKWKAKIEIEATDPEPDDVIKLVASVNSVDRVSFKLHNRFLGYSKFQAYFTSSSSPHFSVTPTNGTLPPFTNENGTEQHEGVNFVITFAPKEYGVVEMATLNILTEDAQWTYLLKGSYPDNAFHTGPLKNNKTLVTRR